MIPYLENLEKTLGSSQICIAVLDGLVNLNHSCFQGADLTRLPTLVRGEAEPTGNMSVHGTHIASVIFGQPGSPVVGISPQCKGLIIPVFSDSGRHLSQLDLARAIEQAVNAGAHIINISGGQLTDEGEAEGWLQKSVQLAQSNNVLIVAAAGNDGGECLHVPAALPAVLVVGAMSDRGEPMNFSNWGETYQSQGILAPGENILGAHPGGRDSFKQLMPAYTVGEITVPANPYDARQMVDYLAASPSEARSLIWTLNIELTPVYAIEPQGAFARETYAVLQELLAGQIQSETSEEFVERVSIPGVLTGRTVKLFSGQVVPLLAPQNPRGMYGWKINTLVSAAIETVQTSVGDAQEETIRRTLGSFLSRIYYDLRNLGTTSQDRALNFAATNAFQAASTFAEAVATGMELDSINVEKSPFCRVDSDCWDVKLKFFDPENSRRAKKVFRFTIDVSDLIPVTLGDVRTWSTPY